MKKLYRFPAGVVLAFLVGTGPSLAQSNAAVPFDFESGETSLLSGTPHPALLSDFKIEGYDYLEASLAVESKGASVTWAPFLVPNLPGGDYSLLSETRLLLSQKDNVTSLGISLKYNPLNPLSDNGRAKWSEYWRDVNAKSPHSTFALDLNSAKTMRRDILRDREFAELTLLADRDCPCEIDRTESACPLQIDRIEGLAAKVLKERDGDPTLPGLLYRVHCGLQELAPRRAECRAEIEQLEFASETPDEAAIKQKKKILAGMDKAHGILIAASERAYLASRGHLHGGTTLAAIRAEMALLDKEIAGVISSYAASSYTGYRERLYSSRLPVINLSYVTSFFGVIDGRADADQDGLNDNEHRTRSRSLALSVDWQLGERDGVSFLLSRSTERPSAEEGSMAADYNGFGATWSHLLTILDKDGYKRSKDYKESLFVPSIVLGIAYEDKECDSPNADCNKGVLQAQALTPFIDFKIKKSAQFRIGVPFRRNRIFRAGQDDTEEDSIDIVSLVAFQLGAPK